MIGLGAKSVRPGEPFLSNPSSYRGHLMSGSWCECEMELCLKGRETVPMFVLLPLYDVKQMNWIQPTISNLSSSSFTVEI